MLKTWIANIPKGSYAIKSHPTTNLLTTRLISLTHGVYAYTGQSVHIPRRYSLPAISGSFGFDYNSALLLKGRRIFPHVLSYSYSGQTQQLLHGRIISANFGTISLSGENTTYTHDRAIKAQIGRYSTIGGNSLTVKDWVMKPIVGDYAYTGIPTLPRGTISSNTWLSGYFDVEVDIT